MREELREIRDEEIRKLATRGRSYTDIAKQYGISRSRVGIIAKGCGHHPPGPKPGEKVVKWYTGVQEYGMYGTDWWPQCPWWLRITDRGHDQYTSTRLA
jgi:hypothetical protein